MTNLSLFQEYSTDYIRISINIICPNNRIKEKNHIIILIDIEKVFVRMQYPFVILKVEGNFNNLINSTYKKLLPSILFKSKMLEV